MKVLVKFNELLFLVTFYVKLFSVIIKKDAQWASFFLQFVQILNKKSFTKFIIFDSKSLDMPMQYLLLNLFLASSQLQINVKNPSTF